MGPPTRPALQRAVEEEEAGTGTGATEEATAFTPTEGEAKELRRDTSTEADDEEEREGEEVDEEEEEDEAEEEAMEDEGGGPSAPATTRWTTEDGRRAERQSASAPHWRCNAGFGTRLYCYCTYMEHPASPRSASTARPRWCQERRCAVERRLLEGRERPREEPRLAALDASDGPDWPPPTAIDRPSSSPPPPPTPCPCEGGRGGRDEGGGGRRGGETAARLSQCGSA